LDNGENNGLKNGVWRVDAERELLEANARDEAWRIAVNMAKLPDLLPSHNSSICFGRQNIGSKETRNADEEI
jgi:hypothetical protein